MLLLQSNQIKVMDSFLDNIQIDEFDCIVPNEAMFDLYEDNWESLTESDIEDWSLIQD